MIMLEIQNKSPVIAAVIEHMNDDELREFDDLTADLNTIARQDQTYNVEMPDHTPSFAHAINQASPNVRTAVTTLFHLLNEPGEPFKRMDFQRTCDALGLDEHQVRRVHDIVKNDDITRALQERMGVDENIRPGYQRDWKKNPPDRRETIAATIDQNQDVIDRRNAIDDYTKNAAEGLTLRQVLKTIVDKTEDFDGAYSPKRTRE